MADRGLLSLLLKATCPYILCPFNFSTAQESPLEAESRYGLSICCGYPVKTILVFSPAREIIVPYRTLSCFFQRNCSVRHLSSELFFFLNRVSPRSLDIKPGAILIENFTAIFTDNNHVLKTHPTPVRQVNTRFDGDNHSSLQMFSVA